MTSSADKELEKWVAAKAPIRASFIGNGVAFASFGRLEFSANGEDLRLIDRDGAVVLVMPFRTAAPIERVEPLIDAPEELRWKIDFFLGLAFRVPCGVVDLLEIARDEVDMR